MTKCKWCEKEFKSEKSLSSHKRFCKNKPERFFCKCGSGFKEKNDFYQHRKTCDKTIYLIRDYNKEWICGYCNKRFETRKLLFEHNKICSYRLNNNFDSLGRIIPKDDGTIFRCEFCGRTTKSKQGNSYHKKSCKKNPNREKWTFEGKKHSRESIKEIRKSTIEFLKKNNKFYKSRYNPESCKFIDKLNNKNNWKLQHAENGGEIEIEGYFLDAYDKENNIVFEYDEARHYQDVYNNVLIERDVRRMNYIKEKLDCDFYRYNEELDLFYKC